MNASGLVLADTNGLWRSYSHYLERSYFCSIIHHIDIVFLLKVLDLNEIYILCCVFFVG
jgi:hypothetical protein